MSGVDTTKLTVQAREQAWRRAVLRRIECAVATTGASMVLEAPFHYIGQYCLYVVMSRRLLSGEENF